MVLLALTGRIGYALPESGRDGLIDGFRPPSVPLIVVDPYFRFVQFPASIALSA